MSQYGKMIVCIDLYPDKLKHLETRLDPALDLQFVTAYKQAGKNQQPMRQFDVIVSDERFPIVEALLKELEIPYDALEYRPPRIVPSMDDFDVEY